MSVRIQPLEDAINLLTMQPGDEDATDTMQHPEDHMEVIEGIIENNKLTELQTEDPATFIS